MKANELRIGNLINPNVGELDHIGEISSINGSSVWLDLIDENYEEWLSREHERDLDKITPIPLTEEWLLKFGFRKEGDFFTNDMRITIWKDINSFPGFLADWATETIGSVKYVHQLQNLYFALTNEELTLKP